MEVTVEREAFIKTRTAMWKMRHWGAFGILATYLLTCGTVAYGQNAFFLAGETFTERENYTVAQWVIYAERKPRSKRRRTEPQLTDVQLQIWDLATAQWNDHLRISSRYNSAGNVFEALVSEWKDGAWAKFYRATYTYDVGEDRSGILYQEWNAETSVWQDDSQVSYTYANDNACYQDGEWKERLYKRLHEEQGWVNQVRISVTYDADCVQTYLIESWDQQAGQWNTQYATISRMNELGLPIDVTDHEWDATQKAWRPLMYRQISYNGMGDFDTYIVQKWVATDQHWMNEMRYHNTKFEVSEPLEERHFAMWDQEKQAWVDDCQVHAAYDAMGNVETVTTERYWSFPANVVENSPGEYGEMSERKVLTYDEHGLNTERMYQKWYAEGGKWHADRRVQYTYAQVNTQQEAPSVFVLSEVYPNPFSTRATVSLTLDRTQSVKVNVFNILGQHVASLHSGVMQADVQHHLTFDGMALPSGTYWIRIDGETASYTRSAVLVK